MGPVASVVRAAREPVQAQVDAVNATLSRTEQVRRWALLPREWTVEAGELTPTHKLRRDVVAARHADLIEELYP